MTGTRHDPERDAPIPASESYADTNRPAAVPDCSCPPLIVLLENGLVGPCVQRELDDPHEPDCDLYTDPYAPDTIDEAKGTK